MANKNLNFDFESLSVKSIQVIDSIRTREKSGNIKSKEPRINAFYRALGFPAWVPKLRKNDPPRDPYNISNVFESGNFEEEIEKKLNIRKQAAVGKLKDQDINNFLYFISNKPSDALGSDNSSKRSSGVLLPFVVDGSIDIYPQNRRVGGAFLKDTELTVGNTKYHRPLIETIILHRLSGSGVVNSVGQNSQFTELTQFFLANLESSLHMLPAVIEDAVRRVQEFSLYTRVKAIPDTFNIAEQNPVTQLIDTDVNSLGQLDQKQIAQEQRRIIRESQLALFEFSDIFSESDTNIKAGLLASELLLGKATIETSGAEEINTRETNEDIEFAVQEIKKSYKILDLVLGTFSGISGIDIMVVVIALFKVELNILVSLLNEDARVRLDKLKNNITRSMGIVSLDQAFSQLEQKIKELYDTIDTQIFEPTYSNKEINQEN